MAERPMNLQMNYAFSLPRRAEQSGGEETRKVETVVFALIPEFEQVKVRDDAGHVYALTPMTRGVDLVTKVPRLMDENQVDLTLGSHNYRRGVGDFNFKLGQSTALRVGAMSTKADSNGAGSSLDKVGVAGAIRTGIGERHEFSLAASFLENRNGMNYGMPFIRPTTTSPVNETTLLPIDPDSYYGMASDENYGQAQFVTLNHVWRLAPAHGAEHSRAPRPLRTRPACRHGAFCECRHPAGRAGRQPGQLRPQHGRQSRFPAEDPGHADDVCAE